MAEAPHVIPAVFVATVAFMDGAEHQARALCAQPLAVYVEHPIQDRTEEEMLRIADRAIDELVRQPEAEK